MKAARIHEFGTPDALRFEDVADPVPGVDEALVRVGAVGLNHIDLDVRAGTSRMPLQLPAILGMEFAGEIVGFGAGVTAAPELAAGTEVAVSYTVPCWRCSYCRTGRDNLCSNRQLYGVTRPGAYAQLVACPVRSLLPLPPGLDVSGAAATQIAFSTAWHVLITRACLQPGQTALIHAAGSGIGSAALQVARLAGARIIASAGSELKRQRTQALADHVVDYTRPGWTEEVRDLTEGNGVDVVMSHVGGEEFRGSIDAVRNDGAVVIVGGHSGEVVDLDLIPFFRRQIRLIGSSRATQAEIANVLRLAGQGVFRPSVHAVLPLSAADAAHRLLEDREAYGKVLLDPTG